MRKIGIRTLQAVLAVAQESEPGGAVGAWLRLVMSGKHAPYYVLVNLEIEDQGNLIGDTLVTEVRVPAFHLDDHGDQFRRGSFGTLLAPGFRCEEKAVFPFDRCAMEAEHCGGLQDNG